MCIYRKMIVRRKEVSGNVRCKVPLTNLTNLTLKPDVPYGSLR